MELDSKGHQSEIERLDAHIRDLTQQLLNAKIQRNALLRISSLPDEILFKIMFEYALLMDIFSNKWMGILVVCRRWHEIASSHAQLWSFVKHSRYRRGPDIWDRIDKSKDHPLTAVFDPVDELHASAPYYMLQGHKHRVRSLTLVSGKTAAMERAFQETDSLPLLETLAIRNWSEDNYSLPAFIFDGGAPRLHNIELNGVDFSDWNKLSNITQLTFTHLRRDHPLLTMDDLLSVLERSPRLRYLNIKTHFPGDTITAVSSSVALPCLEHVELAGRSDSLDTFFQFVTLPARTSLNIKVSNYDSEARWLSGLLVRIRRHLRKPGAPVLCSVSLSGDLMSYCTLVADTIAPARSEFNDDQPHFILIAYPWRQRFARRIFTQVLDALPLESATHVDLLTQCRRDFTPRTLCTVFQHIPRAEVVRVGVNDGMLAVVEGLMDAVRRGLRGRWGAKRRRATKGIQWPTRLHLVASRDGQSDGRNEAQQIQWYDALQALLTEYKAMDAPFKPAGVPWGMLEFTHVEHGYLTVDHYREKLFPLTGSLMLYGRPWDPISERKDLKRMKKSQRKWAKKYNFTLPPSDDDLSSDSESDSESDSPEKVG
ncbi:hypothetical protein FA95DRAFT_1604910 [Auriscalpium vulgare]|uniref:Uncharacterized protein n=1 Tax=Auriscalpium vulgare TaxID=40419 RepID=A0ACB8RY04_9AGAM|nr:hypothetical protein FA95DRAFT_1604910 [Auriscalpium vulgare]